MRPRKPVVSYPKSSKQSACADIHPRNLSLNVPENISQALDKEMYKFLYPSKSSLVQTIICEYFGKEIAYSEIFPEKGRLQLRKPNNSCDRSQLVRITVSINNGLHKKLKLRATNYGITINEVVSAIFHDRYFPELLSDEIYTKKEERYIEIPADKIDEFVVNFVKENLTSPYSPEDKKSKKKKSEKSRYLFL